MTKIYEFDLIFSIPTGANALAASIDAVFEAGFEDAVVGSGDEGRIGIALEHVGKNALEAVLDAALAIVEKLPTGSFLVEVAPEVVSLAEVAERLNVSRQALQKRRMPAPDKNGLYRASEILETLSEDTRGRIFENLEGCRPWLETGRAAMIVNGFLAVSSAGRDEIDHPLLAKLFGVVTKSCKNKASSDAGTFENLQDLVSA